MCLCIRKWVYVCVNVSVYTCVGMYMFGGSAEEIHRSKIMPKAAAAESTEVGEVFPAMLRSFTLHSESSRISQALFLKTYILATSKTQFNQVKPETCIVKSPHFVPQSDH